MAIAGDVVAEVEGVPDEEHVCDECDRSFDSQRGLSSHEAQAH